MLLGFTAVTTAIVQYTPLGLRLYAVGEFPDAARAAGLPLRRLLAGAFVASGVSGGIAGILSVSYLSGSTTGAGEMLLPVVVTALLGSVFSRLCWFQRSPERCFRPFWSASWSTVSSC